MLYSLLSVEEAAGDENSRTKSFFLQPAVLVLLRLVFLPSDLLRINFNTMQLSITITTKVTDNPTDSPITVEISKNIIRSTWRLRT